jgi:hypothetical protein
MRKDLFCTYVPNRKTDSAAVDSFLSKGGHVVKLRQDDGKYEKHTEKLEQKLGGLIRPFSKTDALALK